MRHSILMLCGSNRDIDREGNPNSQVELLFSSLEKWNREHPHACLEVDLRVCSADRTPFLLPSILNEQRVQGILYFGGYSLVLGAAIQEALLHLRSSDYVRNFIHEFTSFLEKTEKDREFFPSRFSPTLVTTERSKYFSDAGFIPTIGIPSVDVPSQGVTAFCSVSENPPGCEPRPVVGVKRMDTAIQTMGQILRYREQGCSKVHFLFEAGNSQAKEGIQAIVRRLQSFATVSLSIQSSEVFLENHKGEDQEERPLIVYVGDAMDKGLKILEYLDAQFDLIIHCPTKREMTSQWLPYLQTLDKLNHTLHVGVGGYDNAASLVTRIWNHPQMLQGMWKFRNEKTEASIMHVPEWLTKVCKEAL